MTAPKHLRKNAARAGFEPGIDQGERLFQAVVDTNMKTLMRNPEWNRNKRAGTIALSPEDAEVIFSSSPRRRLCRNDKMDSFSSCHAGPRSGIQWCNTKKTTGFRVKPGMT